MPPSDYEWPEELRPLLGTLTDLERRVLLLRFGFDRDNPRSLEEVGEELGISRQEVRVIEAGAFERLKVIRDLD